MPGTVYTVASGKGGVGKTTTSVNLAVALWREGNAVALVDADIGMANLAAVLDLDPEETLHDVLAGRATVEEAVIEAKDGDLLVLPGDRGLEGFVGADPDALGAVVTDLAERVDYVIVDTGAGLSYEDVLPLGLADGVVLVTTPDPSAFGDTRKTKEIAGLLGAPVRGLVVTRAVEDTDPEAIASEIGAELLGAIPEDSAVMASTVAGDPLESHAPDSAAAAAYRDLAVTVVELDGAAKVAGAPAAEPADAADDDGGETAVADEGGEPAPSSAPVEAGGSEADEGADATAVSGADELAEDSATGGDGPTQPAAGPDDAPAPEADESEAEGAGASEPAAEDASGLAAEDASEPAAAAIETPAADEPTDDEPTADEPTADGSAAAETADDEVPGDDGPEPEDDGLEPGDTDDPGDEHVETTSADEPAEEATATAGDSSDGTTGSDVSEAPGGGPDATEGAPEEEPAEEEGEPTAEAGEPDVDEGASAVDEEESVAEAESDEVDGESDGGRKRGGFFGWLGRLFS